MFYTIYKITNQINGKFYIGSHKTKDLNDNYMGSGKYLKHAQEKHGIEHFKKEILFVFDTPEEMYAKEAEIVNEDFLAEENTYNLKVGGYGGFDFINSSSKNVYGKNGKRGYGGENLKRGDDLKSMLLENDSWDSYKESISNTIKLKIQSGEIVPGFTGKRHSDKTKKLISDANSKHQAGERNSQFGTMWITNGISSKKINKHDCVPEGWVTGRKIKINREVE